jgi:hypothetical protein
MEASHDSKTSADIGVILIIICHRIPSLVQRDNHIVYLTFWYYETFVFVVVDELDCDDWAQFLMLFICTQSCAYRRGGITWRRRESMNCLGGLGKERRGHDPPWFNSRQVSTDFLFLEYYEVFRDAVELRVIQVTWNRTRLARSDTLMRRGKDYREIIIKIGKLCNILESSLHKLEWFVC